MAHMLTSLISVLLFALTNAQLPGLYAPEPAPGFLLLIKVNEGRSVTVIYRCDVNSDTDLFAGPYLLSPASAPNEYSLVSGTVIEVADAVTLIRGNCAYVDIADDDLGILNFDGSTLRVTVQGNQKSLKRQYALPQYGYRTAELDIELKLFDGVHGTMFFACGANKASTVTVGYDYNSHTSQYDVAETSARRNDETNFEKLSDSLRAVCGVTVSSNDLKSVGFSSPTTAEVEFRGQRIMLHEEKVETTEIIDILVIFSRFGVSR